MISRNKVLALALTAVMVMGISSCGKTDDPVEVFTPIEITEDYSGPILGISDWHIETEDLSWGGVSVSNIWFVDDTSQKKFAVYGGLTDEANAYLADLNGDGEPELVCNGSWGVGSDFHSCTCIYRLNDGVIEIAYPCYGDLDSPAASETYPYVAEKLGISIDYTNYKEYSDKYDPTTNKIKLINADGTEYEIKYDYIKFKQFDSPEAKESTETELLKSEEIDIIYDTAEPVVTDISDCEKEITFYRDGMEINGELYLPEGDGPFPVIVLSCGLMQPYTDYVDDAKSFADNGYAAVVFSFVDYSDPDAAESNDYGQIFLSETADLYAVLDSLDSLSKIDSTSVYLWGHSFGGLVSAFTGCERSSLIKGMILVEPSITIGETLLLTIEDGSNKTLRIYDLLSNCKLNTVIYMGTHDGFGDDPSSFDQTIDVLEFGELVIIDGSDHFFEGEYGQKMVEDTCKQIASWNT